jgi:catechol 2,3-dioxygenase-like lactoylglutathione lyase family enzyme
MIRNLPTEPFSPYKLAHAVLRTAHLEEAVRYYQLLLNARVVHEQSPFGAALTYDEEHHRLALIAVPAAEAVDHGTVKGVPVADARGADLTDVAFSATPGLEHLAFTFESLAALLGTYTRVQAAGIKPQFCINHGPTISFYYADPDGHKTELQVDTMPMELADEYIHSDVNAANPIGWPFDPDELVERFEAGDSLAVLMSIGREHVSSTVAL